MAACLAVECLVLIQRFLWSSKKVDSWYKTSTFLINGNIHSLYAVSLQKA